VKSVAAVISVNSGSFVVELKQGIDRAHDASMLFAAGTSFWISIIKEISANGEMGKRNCQTKNRVLQDLLCSLNPSLFAFATLWDKYIMSQVRCVSEASPRKVRAR
jgi:hypothetical protein